MAEEDLRWNVDPLAPRLPATWPIQRFRAANDAFLLLCNSSTLTRPLVHPKMPAALEPVQHRMTAPCLARLQDLRQPFGMSFLAYRPAQITGRRGSSNGETA